MKQPIAFKMKSWLILSSALLALVPVQASAEAVDQTLLVRELLGTYHVSGVTSDKLAGKTIEEMIASLQDPYTAFFSESELQQFGNSIENSYVGMGARVGQDAEGVYISEVFVGSPAEKAGLQKEDYIHSVGGVSAVDQPLDAVVGRIIGEPGTSVEVTVLRGTKPITVNIVRAAVNVPEVYSKYFEGEVGYIQVTDFSSDADEDFAKQLKELQAKGLNSLILDLRNNPGGLLDTALHISKHFIREGTLIHTVDRNRTDDPSIISGGTTQPFPVQVLLNEYSASASEVLSGALQDYDVAKVIGKQSYGKGSVQQVLELEGGGALKVTIQEYLTPDLHKVNKVGIKPDIEVEGSAAQMITALHEAGISTINVEILKHTIRMNGVEVGDSLGIIREDSHVYAHARTLAALVGAKISWNNESRVVEVSTADTKHAFPVEAGTLVINEGTSYIDLDSFTAVFPQLTASVDEHSVSIQATKGN
jgi:carboxyl-terminal processing protease